MSTQVVHEEAAAKEDELAVGNIVQIPSVPFEETLASASRDLLREMIKGLAQRMMTPKSSSRAVRRTGRSARSG
jgi:hypothetical protein